ncbi:hypothetical protein BJY04DRAFT_184396 [Aspergillus karnatakaensis]|uniref:oxidoreductase, short chain dehydrogenase/reductase family n=1 Tax=Aspergillus karnatakaensis TaxID=1810916 RepID=UPI003CCCF39E
MSNFISLTLLHNTRVLLIGGTAGVGFGVARAALEQGASVILSSSNPNRVKNAIAELKNLYPEEPYVSRIAGRACDLSNEETMEEDIVNLFEFATGVDVFRSSGDGDGGAEKLTTTKAERPSCEAGAGAKAGAGAARIPITHIVFTAGTLPTNILPPTDAGVNVHYLKNLETIRFIGGALVAKYAPGYMTPVPSSSSPSITYTTGTAITTPPPGLTHMIAVGSAVEGLTRGLAVDFAPLGIRVNIVRLGPVRTGFLDSVGDESMVEKMRESNAGRTVLGRVGEVTEVAESYLGVMRGGFVSGTVVVCEGGWGVR